ncbi:MAG: single-stranded DNA-binding protein [Acidobacteriota bacterium]
MAGVNKVILIGNLGRDPELRYTQNQTPVCNFTLATNEVWVDKSGQKQERTEWHKVVVWGRQGEQVSKYLKKGSQVFVEGSLNTRSWEDKDGQKRYVTEVKAQNVRFLDRKGDTSSQGGGGTPMDGGEPFKEPDTGFPDDEIPF